MLMRPTLVRLAGVKSPAVTSGALATGLATRTVAVPGEITMPRNVWWMMGIATVFCMQPALAQPPRDDDRLRERDTPRRPGDRAQDDGRRGGFSGGGLGAGGFGGNSDSNRGGFGGSGVGRGGFGRNSGSNRGGFGVGGFGSAGFGGFGRFGGSNDGQQRGFNPFQSRWQPPRDRRDGARFGRAWAGRRHHHRPQFAMGRFPGGRFGAWGRQNSSSVDARLDRLERKMDQLLREMEQLRQNAPRRPADRRPG